MATRKKDQKAYAELPRPLTEGMGNQATTGNAQLLQLHVHQEKQN